MLNAVSKVSLLSGPFSRQNYGTNTHNVTYICVYVCVYIYVCGFMANTHAYLDLPI